MISRRSLNFDSSYSNNWPFRFKMTVYFKECATLKENNNISWWSRWKCFKNKITNVCDDRKCWTAAESSCWNFEWTIWMTLNDDCMTSFDLCLKNYNNMHMNLMHILLLAVYMNLYRLFKQLFAYFKQLFATCKLYYHRRKSYVDARLKTHSYIKWVINMTHR